MSYLQRQRDALMKDCRHWEEICGGLKAKVIFQDKESKEFVEIESERNVDLCKQTKDAMNSVLAWYEQDRVREEIEDSLFKGDEEDAELYQVSQMAFDTMPKLLQWAKEKRQAISRQQKSSFM